MKEFLELQRIKPMNIFQYLEYIYTFSAIPGYRELGFVIPSIPFQLNLLGHEECIEGRQQTTIYCQNFKRPLRIPAACGPQKILKLETYVLCLTLFQN